MSDTHPVRALTVHRRIFRLDHAHFFSFRPARYPIFCRLVSYKYRYSRSFFVFRAVCFFVLSIHMMTHMPTQTTMSKARPALPTLPSTFPLRQQTFFSSIFPSCSLSVIVRVLGWNHRSRFSDTSSGGAGGGGKGAKWSRKNHLETRKALGMPGCKNMWKA